MSRMQPISPITPDVAQMVQAGGQQANVRNQQSIQQAQIAQQGQIAQQQQQVQREQMQNQQQIAQGNRAVQLAGVYEQARSQSEYRDFLREKASVEQDLARQRMSVDAQQHQEEMNLKKGIEQRRFGIEIAQAKAEHAYLSGSLNAQNEEGDALNALREQANQLDLALADANEINQGNERGFGDKRNQVHGELDRFIVASESLVDDVRLGIAGDLTDAAFSTDLKSIIGRDKTAYESIDALGKNLVYAAMSVGGLIGITDEQFDPRVIATLEYMGQETPGVIGDKVNLERKSPTEVLEQRIATSVADGLNLTPEQRGTVESLLSAGMRRASTLDEEGVIQLRSDLNRAFTEAGIGNTLAIFEGLRAAAQTVKGNSTSYRSLGMPREISDLESYSDVVEVPIFDPETGAQINSRTMRADQAFLNSVIFSRDNAVGLNRLVAGGPSLDQLRSFRDYIDPASGLTTQALTDVISRDTSGFGARLQDPLDALIASEDTVENLARDMQRFELKERMGVDRAGFNRARGMNQAGLDASEALIAELERLAP